MRQNMIPDHSMPRGVKLVETVRGICQTIRRAEDFTQ